MCNSEIDDALQNALNEIKQNMNLRGCGREKKVPPSDLYIEKIITGCDTVFEKLQQKLSEPFSEKTYRKVARTSKKYKIDDAVLLAGINSDFDKNQYELTCEKNSYNSLINRATISCKALQQKDESKQKPLNIRTPNKKSLYMSPIYECNLNIPSQYQIEGDIPPNIDTFKALVYALRFSSSPFHVYDCDYPCIAQDLVKYDKNGFHLPFMVMHSRTRRKNTASNQKS